MDKKFFEIIFIISGISRQFPHVRDFLTGARKRYAADELVEIQLYNWMGGDSLGVLLRFDFLTFVPSRLKWCDPWIKKLGLEVIEAEKFGPPEREALMKKFVLTSDMKFSGSYNLDHALGIIESRYSRTRGVRKEKRFSRRIQVSFRTEKDLVREYTENISYGGMFIRGKTDIPLRSRIEIEFKLPGQGGVVKAIGEVVHVVSVEKASLINGDVVPGCGVHFVKFEGDGEEKLRNFIEKVAKKDDLRS